MFGENLLALLMLYARPVAAISRILDRGRLWFAIVAALIVSGLVHLPDTATLQTNPAAMQAGKTTPANQDDDEPKAPAASGFIESAAFSWIGLPPGGFIAPIGALALGFIPLIVLLRAVTGYGSFSVLMRRDYMALLMCLLFIWAAAYIPVAAIIGFAKQGPALLVACVAGIAYFTILAALGLRTLLGVDFAPALGLAAAGSAGAVLALGVSGIAGPLRFMVMSPFFLIYGAYYFYSRFMSEARSLGDGLRSRQHFRRQLEISTTNPSDADAHYQLGLIYEGRRQYTEAISRFQRAVEIDRKEADPHFHLGRIARQQKRIPEAIQHLKTAVALDDKLSQNDVWRELGAAYLDAGKIDEAGPALATFVARRPYDPEGLYYYGKALATVGRSSDAREMFERAIEAVRTMPSHRRAEVRSWGRASKSELSKLG
jgi:tetratricopeptide (TPR) repeat protein